MRRPVGFSLCVAEIRPANFIQLPGNRFRSGPEEMLRETAWKHALKASLYTVRQHICTLTRPVPRHLAAPVVGPQVRSDYVLLYKRLCRGLP